MKNKFLKTILSTTLCTALFVSCSDEQEQILLESENPTVDKVEIEVSQKIFDQVESLNLNTNYLNL